MHPILERIKDGLVVSCQADDGTPTDFTPMIVAFAKSAEMGGAVGLRLNGAEHTAAVRAQTNLPIMAIQKFYPPQGKVLITGDAAAIPPIIQAGADVIAFDASPRERPSSLTDIITTIHDGGALAMADLHRFEDAENAVKLGVDVLATTLSVFDLPDYVPDIDLIRRLVATYDLPVVAEGNFWTPDDIAKAFEAGAHAVVVGSVVSRPWRITEYLVHGTPRKR